MRTFQLGAAEVLCQYGEISKINVTIDLIAVAHWFRVDDLLRLIRQTDLHKHLQATRLQKHLVDHFAMIRSCDDEDVVELRHSVNLDQKLIHNPIMLYRTSAVRAWTLADRIGLVELLIAYVFSDGECGRRVFRTSEQFVEFGHTSFDSLALNLYVSVASLQDRMRSKSTLIVFGMKTSLNLRQHALSWTKLSGQ